ncbi:MAG: DNA-binding protein [Actinobacteria bacterium 69-20]|jgi:amino acid transporter|nr:amino acid permease [Actinomycetota bacterium]OJV28729.1 MAG: DNA-binding protein [Actinobacteria bacterium 69-20]
MTESQRGRATEGPNDPRMSIDIPERLGYRIKCALLGRPLISADLRHQKLSKTVALGVLSPDCISSSAYGTEAMLVELLPWFGMAAFTIVLPITGAILLILVLMTLSYREVVQVYTRAGGSYVVARENFGPRVAQVAAVALLIDYVVTVAVQAAAGTVAVASAVPALGPYSTEITIGVVILIAYGNLRGIREAGKLFALPTYAFTAAMFAVIVVGIIKEISGTLTRYDPHALVGTVPVDHRSGLVFFVVVLVVLRSFANGGSSLTGLEAISNGVSAFRAPQGRNARRVLVIMASILGVLVAGVSWLAHVTHATPFSAGYPSVISQEARAVFGNGPAGHVFYIVVQAASALILYTGANTSFNGFPFLASFVAEDSFLPRQLTKRGHRLVFSNGIIVLAGVSIALIAVAHAKVNTLLPLYAIGVFTGFAMAGFGMARYHHVRRESSWRRRLVINASGGALSALVVLIFVVVKFTEGAWLVVLLFPILVFVFIRLNRQYRAEARSLDLATWIRQDQAEAPRYPRHVVLVMVDTLDLAALRALRYAASLRPTELRAVHFVIDNMVADRLQRGWVDRRLGDRYPLEIVECPDRRLVRSAAEFALSTVVGESAETTVLLPRRTYRRGWGQLLHDRTADRIAAAVGRIPHVAATIVPYDTTLSHDVVVRLEAEERRAAATPALAPVASGSGRVGHAGPRPRRKAVPAPAGRALTPIADAVWRRYVTVEGRVVSVQTSSMAGVSMEARLFDDSGGLRLLFFGRTSIPGIAPGARLRATGRVGRYKDHLAIANPIYELLPEAAGEG